MLATMFAAALAKRWLNLTRKHKAERDAAAAAVAAATNVELHVHMTALPEDGIQPGLLHRASSLRERATRALQRQQSLSALASSAGHSASRQSSFRLSVSAHSNLSRSHGASSRSRRSTHHGPTANSPLAMLPAASRPPSTMGVQRGVAPVLIDPELLTVKS